MLSKEPNIKELKELKITKQVKPIDWNNGNFMNDVLKSQEETKQNNNNNNSNNNNNKANIKVGFIDHIILRLCNLIMKHNRNEVKCVSLMVLNIILNFMVNIIM